MRTNRAKRALREGGTLVGVLLVSLSACGVADQPDGQVVSRAVIITNDAAPARLEVEQPTMPPPSDAAANNPQSTSAGAAPKLQPSPIPPEPLNPTEPPQANPTPTTAPVTGAASAAWQPYRSPQAGYAVEYPDGWTTSEQARPGGGSITTFAPTSGGAQIQIMVQAGEIRAADNDLPNTRCQEITVAGLPAVRCRDTIALSTTTTFSDQKQTYSIMTAGKQFDAAAYQHMLDSFQIVP